MFLETAKLFEPVTDKVTEHQYHIMYGQLLLPYYNSKPWMKMLEIGLDSDMDYGPSASVALWDKLFPQADLWEAEYDGKCVQKHVDEGKLNSSKILVGVR